MEKRKLIFLDIDGTLTEPGKLYRQCGGGGYIEYGHHCLWGQHERPGDALDRGGGHLYGQRKPGLKGACPQGLSSP